MLEGERTIDVACPTPGRAYKQKASTGNIHAIVNFEPQ